MAECYSRTGVTSILFGIVATFRGGEFYTYDIEDQRPDYSRRMWKKMEDVMTFTQQDLLSGIVSHVLEKVKKADIVLYDNGDKVCICVETPLTCHLYRHLS